MRGVVFFVVLIMIKNLLLIALRNLRKDKWYNVLNILGLTIGITFSLFLIFYISDELGYDRFYKNVDRIYRINSYIQEKDKATDWALTQLPMGPQMKKDYPQVEQMVRIISDGNILVRKGNDNIQDHKVAYADSTFFKVFPLPMVQGDAATALNEPHSITRVPCFASPGTMEIVNASTGAVSVSLVILDMPRLRERSYEVPHCPVCLFTIRSTPSACGTVHSVYIPAGTCMPARIIGADVVNCVASFAPVRHTRS